MHKQMYSQTLYQVINQMLRYSWVYGLKIDIQTFNIVVCLLPHMCNASGVKVIGVGFHIREYGSTLYVGLARAVSPTNTNFRLTFLLTRLQEALYEDLAV